MISLEKENVNFIEPIDVSDIEKKENVELWLLEIEKSMFDTL